MIFYDHPLNEQVRVFLRLAALFRRVRHFLRRDDALDHHTALLTLFEIVDATARADAKSELLQGLERQRGVLVALRQNPQIENQRLEDTLRELDSVMESLHQTVGKLAEHLRNHDGLMAIKQRVNIPGGLCDFDLPSYHYWLSQLSTARHVQFDAWLSPLLSTHAALELHIRLLLESGKSYQLEAHHGVYQQNKVGSEARLIRVGLADNEPCIPEVSANKYLLSIRFWDMSGVARTLATHRTIPFELMFCSF